jgi:hypothetical protein
LQRLPAPAEASLPPCVRIGNYPVIHSDLGAPQDDVDTDPRFPAVDTYNSIGAEDDDDVIIDSSHFNTRAFPYSPQASVLNCETTED